MSNNRGPDQSILYPLIAIIVGLLGNIVNFLTDVQALYSTVGFFAFTLLIGVGVIGVFVRQDRIKLKDGILYAVIWTMFIALSGAGYYILSSQPVTVSGRVLDNVNQRSPMSDIEVSLYHYETGTTRQVLTDSNGEFRFGDVQDGEYDLIINGVNIYSGDMPSGWRKLFEGDRNTGRFYLDNIAAIITNTTPVPTPEQTSPEAPTDTPLPPTDTPANTPEPPTATNTAIPTPTDTPMITLTHTSTNIPEELILYEEDFEDGDADRLTIVNGAAYVTVDDENRVYLVGHDSRQTFFHLGDAEWSDYRVEIHFKPIDLIGPSYDNLGFGVRSDNYFSGYWLTLPGGWWQRRINNQGEDMTEWIDASLIRDDWNTLYIECRNGVIRTMLNELVIPDLHDDAFQQGKIGFMTEPGIYMLVDNIRVWSLDTDD